MTAEPHNRCGSSIADARAMRLVLALVDNDEDAFLATLHETGDCTDCLRGLIGGLAGFGADRVTRSPTPERWERWLLDRIAKSLDEAQDADA